MATTTNTKTKKQEELEALLKEASDYARTAIRSNAEMIEVQIIDWYEQGNDKNTGEPIQPIEVKVDGEEDIRRYSVKGTDAIVSCFGKPVTKNGITKYSNVTYNDEGIPSSCFVPDIQPGKDGTFWYSIRKL